TIANDAVTVRDADGKEVRLENDVVFVMIGREAPLDFFRRSGIPIRGEWRGKTWIAFVAFFLFCVFLYNWKASCRINKWFQDHKWFPFDLKVDALGPLGITLKDPGFYYSLAYCVCVVLFGIARIRRRKTPYVKKQTLVLMAVQVVPLFLLPYLI